MSDVVFWAAVQGVGTVLTAVAAVIALVIAGRQLGQLVASNRFLAASNDAMTESNIALIRPYVVVDLELTVMPTRSGDTAGTAVFVVVRNDGKTAAHNITMSTNQPFKPVSNPDNLGWEKSLAHLNRLTDGVTVLRSLTNTRPLKFYLDDESIFGVDDEPGPVWVVTLHYEDASGREFGDEFALEIEPWRLSLAAAEPLRQMGKYVDAVAHELKTLTRTMNSVASPVAARGGGEDRASK